MRNLVCTLPQSKHATQVVYSHSVFNHSWCFYRVGSGPPLYARLHEIENSDRSTEYRNLKPKEKEQLNLSLEGKDIKPFEVIGEVPPATKSYPVCEPAYPRFSSSTCQSCPPAELCVRPTTKGLKAEGSDELMRSVLPL